MNFIRKLYNPLIHFALRKKYTVLLSALFLLALSLVVFSNMGGEFIPTLEEGDFAVETRVMKGSLLFETIETFHKASAILLENFPEIKNVVGKIGSGEIPTDPMPIEACDLMINDHPQRPGKVDQRENKRRTCQ